MHKLFKLSASVLAILAIIAVATLLLSNSDDGVRSSVAAAQSRTLVVFGAPVGSDAEVLQLTLENQGGGGKRPISTPDRYTAIAISPTGGTIAGLATARNESDTDKLHLVNVVTGAEQVLIQPSDADVVSVTWSPDGAALALVGSQTKLLSPIGQTIAQQSLPKIQEGGSTVQVGGGYFWSPDSTRFVTAINGHLAVLSKNGATRLINLKDLGVTGSALEPATILNWTGPESLALAVSVGGTATNPGTVTGYTLSLSGASATITPLPVASLPRHPSNQPVSPDALTSVQAIAKGGNASRSKPAAGGLADIFEVQRGSDQDSPNTRIRLVVRERATGAVFEVRDVPANSRSGLLYDAVVLP